MRTVAIHQPNFLPWLGYFDKIRKSDHFVFLDDVAFVKGHICNRNKIKTQEGDARWMTVPVNHKKGLDLNFNELQLDYSQKWPAKICNHIRGNYAKAPFFKEYFEEFENLLKNKKYSSIAQLNVALIKHCCKILNIKTTFSFSSEIKEDLGTKNDRNINICLHHNADVYLSGQGAKEYNDEAAFAQLGLELRYQEFEHPRYPQLGDTFIPKLCILDLIFNCGPDSKDYV